MSTSDNNITDNMGGINKVYPIKTTDIVTFGAIRDAKIASLEVNNLEKLDMDPEQIKFSEKQKSGNGGFYFQPSLEGFFWKDDYDIGLWIEQNKNYKFILLLEYNNGIKKIVGTPQTPLRLVADPDPGTIESANGVNISFSGKTTKRAAFYEEE